MTMLGLHTEDLNQILASRHDDGADFWATPDGRIGIERPISTHAALLVMSELGVPRSHEALRGAAELVPNACREDGRVRIAPEGLDLPMPHGTCRRGTLQVRLCRS